MYRLYCDPVLIYAAVNQMLLLKSNPLLVAEASSTIEESPINQVQRIGNGWSRVTTNTATAAALSTPATRPRQLRTTEQSLIISHRALRYSAPVCLFSHSCRNYIWGTPGSNLNFGCGWWL